MYSCGDIRHYFEKIFNAKNCELSAFAKEIKKHAKLDQDIRFATEIIPQGKRRLNIHEDLLLKAIKWEKTKRSKFKMIIHCFVKPWRKWFWGFWFGADMLDTEHLGPVKEYRKSGRTRLEYLGMRKCLFLLLKAVWHYFIRNHKWIITTTLGVIIAIWSKLSL